MRVSAGGILVSWLVWEDTHPDAAAALDVAREGDTSRLDLAGGEPPAVRRLQAEVAEGQAGPAPCGAAAAALHHLSVFDFFGASMGRA
jgi:hypothetical protein